MKKEFCSEKELDRFAVELINKYKNKRVFLFEGDLGSGKTTLIKKICETLKIKSKVTSPSFSIINEYNSSSGPIFHIDLYRIEDIGELHEIGIEEYIESGNYCFIEWPKSIMNLLVKDYVLIKIKIKKQSREFKIIEY